MEFVTGILKIGASSRTATAYIIAPIHIIVTESKLVFITNVPVNTSKSRSGLVFIAHCTVGAQIKSICFEHKIPDGFQRIRIHFRAGTRYSRIECDWRCFLEPFSIHKEEQLVLDDWTANASTKSFVFEVGVGKPGDGGIVSAAMDGERVANQLANVLIC